MKLLVVDHNALDPTNRTIYERVVELGGIDLRLIVPTKWFNNYATLRFVQPSHKRQYELFACDVLFSSRTHRHIYLSLHRHVKEFCPDVFFINAEPENFQTYQAALCAKSSKLVFSSWRNIDHAKVGYPYKLSFIHEAMEKFVLRKAAHGIVFNHDARKLFELHGYNCTTVIPPSVDTSVFTPKSPQRKQKFVVGYAGRLAKAKGINILLEAIALLPDACEALIVGDGVEKGPLQSLAFKLGIQDRVKFMDGSSNNAMPEILSSMDALVLPSLTTTLWKEQFGRVLIEAMACGVPVIGSTSGEIPTVIGDAGLVFKEGSVEGLRLGIERLTKSETLGTELRVRGRRRVESLYSLEVVAKEYHRLFHAL